MSETLIDTDINHNNPHHVLFNNFKCAFNQTNNYDIQAAKDIRR